MSTLEAVAAAVNKLEGAKAAGPLESLYDEVVRRTIALRWGVKPYHSETPRPEDDSRVRNPSSLIAI
jgi:hypothetical protein